MIIATVIIILLISTGMLLLRAFLGASAFDRILALNNIGTHVVVLIVLLGFLKGTEFFIDIALIYGLISFISVIAFLMYFKYRREE